MSKKIAMVAPRPSQPKTQSILPTDPEANDRKLAEILQMFGNDRPYTVIRRHKYSWSVLFLGDDQPVTIKFSGEKPEIE